MASLKRSKPMTLAGVGGDQFLSVTEPSPAGAILRPMKVEEIAEVVAKLPPDQLARFRRWFTAFEAGRPDHADMLRLLARFLRALGGFHNLREPKPPEDWSFRTLQA